MTAADRNTTADAPSDPEKCKRCGGEIRTWDDAFAHTRNAYCLAILEARK